METSMAWRHTRLLSDIAILRDITASSGDSVAHGQRSACETRPGKRTGPLIDGSVMTFRDMRALPDRELGFEAFQCCGFFRIAHSPSSQVSTQVASR
jgi:hypothetical protein